MTEADQIVALVLEADDEETIKDILGPEYQEPPHAEVAGDVYRQDRWADVEIGDKHFCISYLTPVAVFQPGHGVIRTDKRWSTSTLNHIKKWLTHIGYDMTKTRWPEVEARFPDTMPQQRLIDMFRNEAMRVKWSKRQARKLDAVPDRVPFYKSGSEERISIDPHSVPKREWEE